MKHKQLKKIHLMHKRILMSTHPRRKEVYEDSRSQAALTPFHNAATPSPDMIFLAEPAMPRAPYSDDIWMRVCSFVWEDGYGYVRMDCMSRNRERIGIYILQASGILQC